MGVIKCKVDPRGVVGSRVRACDPLTCFSRYDSDFGNGKPLDFIFYAELRYLEIDVPTMRAAPLSADPGIAHKEFAGESTDT
eukprot:764711-Hanusia_phi.AAC.3